MTNTRRETGGKRLSFGDATSQNHNPFSLHRSQISDGHPLERYASRKTNLHINNQLSGKNRQVAKRYRSAPFHFHLTAFKVLLYRFLGTSDICIGIADNCRRDYYVRKAIRPLLNLLPLRINPSADQLLGEAMKEARQKSLSVLTNSTPLEVMVNRLHVAHPSTHIPLAQAFLNHAEKIFGDGQSFLRCRMETMKHDLAELRYDITFAVIDNTTGDTHIILNVQETLH